MKIPSRAFLAAMIIVALAGGLGGGYYLWGSSEEPQEAQSLLKEVVNHDEGKPETVDFGHFWDVWNRLHEKYVDSDELDTEALVIGAIQGMVNAVGDPHTVYLEPVTNRQFQEDIRGEFSGVGMEIAIRNGVLTVVTPLKGSPAEQAGIEAGDVIVKIDDTDTEGMPIEEAVTLIRGERQTTVRLTVARDDVTELLVFPISRDTIKIPALEWVMLDGNIAYLRLFTFSQNVDDEFQQAVQEIRTSGADRLIVDVRNNPGGLLDAAVNIAGFFLPKDAVVVSEDFGQGITRNLRAAGRAELAGMKTVFLINGGSASASEILAGAVHDIKGVPLVGETTFGKGSVQQLEQFNDGSSLKVTVAKWLTPGGISISEEGISPSHPISLDLDTLTTEERDAIELGTPGSDPQLDRAIEIVNTL